MDRPDVKKFNEIRDTLDRSGIRYKYEVKDQLGEWTGRGTLRGTIGSAGNLTEQMKQYEIFVEKKEFEKAKAVV